MQNYLENKNKLEGRLLELTAELETIATKDLITDDWAATPEVEEGGSDADENSHADKSEDLEGREAMTANLELEYHNIKRALDKIAAGAYGVCEICAEPIEMERLAFKPEARTCKMHMNEESQLSL
jgi:DnaK suppressor protein